MESYWAVEDIGGNTNYKGLIEELGRSGAEVFIAKDSSWVPPETHWKRPLMAKGSIELLGNLQKSSLPFQRDLFNDSEIYSYLKYSPKIRNLMLNFNYETVSFREIWDKKWDIFKRFGYDSEIFIRPDSGSKPFTGRIFSLEELEDYDRFTELYEKIFNELVIVSKPQQIVGEWRFFCSAEKIIGVSSYRFQGNDIFVGGAPNLASDLCLNVLACGVGNDPFKVVDVCQVESGRFFVVEMNCFSTSGLYAANLPNLVKALNEYSINQY